MPGKEGFSLIELLIAMAIVGLLSAIAIPIYSQHVAKEYRVEAIVSLTQLAVALEQYYSQHNSYQDVSLSKLGIQSYIAHDHYVMSITRATTSEYEIAASSEKDSLCRTLTLNSKGEQGSSGLGKLSECW